MTSKAALLSKLLLASVVLALPSPRLESRLARRRENRRSQQILNVESAASADANVVYSSNWAGAIQVGANGTFTLATGTFTVPTPSGPDGSAAIWVGIDGYTCPTAILQTGVDVTISNGTVSYDAWYEWFPDASYDFSGITFSAGDVVSTTVIAYSAKSGTTIVENLNTGQIVREDLNSTHALCGENAEWIVEDYLEANANASVIPFVDFGVVTFTDAVASGLTGTIYTPSGATIIDIKQNATVLTSVIPGEGNVTISYV